MSEGNLTAVLAILTPILACVTTIVGLYFKDKADARRWAESRVRGEVRHAENSQKLEKIEENVNGRMAQLVDAVDKVANTDGG